MSNPRQDAAPGEAARSGATDDDEKRTGIEQPQTPGYVE